MSEHPYGQAFIDFWKKRSPREGSYASHNEKISVDGGEITLRVVRPAGEGDDATYPVMVWFHGGGWIIDMTDVDAIYLTSLSADLRIVTVNVEYRLAPQYPFPYGINDCVAAMKWVVNNAASFHVSLDKGFIVGGDSAGGNLAAAAVQVTRADPLFAGASAVTGSLLREPVLVHPDVLPEKYKGQLRSANEDVQDPVLTKESMERFYELYAGPKDDPRVSPLIWTGLASLPRTYIQVNERDILRDHGILYEKALRAEGVPTKLDFCPGGTHGHYCHEPATEIAREVDRTCRAGLRWLLSGSA